MEKVEPLAPLEVVRPAVAIQPSQHVAPAAHSEAAAHGAQDAAMEAAAQQATVAEELGREAVERIEGADPMTHATPIAAVMPDAPRRRAKRRPRRSPAPK